MKNANDTNTADNIGSNIQKMTFSIRKCRTPKIGYHISKMLANYNKRGHSACRFDSYSDIDKNALFHRITSVSINLPCDKSLLLRSCYEMII